jgi:hypothetical protein
MKTIAIGEASAAQLAEFASSHLGVLGASATVGKDRLLEIIREVGHEGDTIQVFEEKKPRKAVSAPDHERKVRIHIAVAEGTAGSQPVPVGVNGILMLIPRGKDVEIPWRYLHALQNAKTKLPVTDDDGQIVDWREAPAYPVSVLAA